MSRHSKVHDYQDLIEKAAKSGVKVPPNAGAALDRYLDAVEARSKAVKRTMTRREAKGILDKIIEHFDFDPKVCEVDDLVMDSEPYGDETIGCWIRFFGDDVYDDTLVWTFEDGFHLASWGDEYEAWEEEQYTKDPWPKIQHDGPQGSEDIVTPDYINFYPYDFTLRRDGPNEPIFSLPFTEDEVEDLKPARYREEADWKDPNERRWWIAFFTALIYAEHQHRKTPGAYWVSRHLDYFWTLRERETNYGGVKGTSYDIDNFHYSADGRGKVETLLKWQNRRAARIARKAPPALRMVPPAAAAGAPQHGDLYTDSWDAKLASGITFYEIDRGGRPLLPLFTITRREVAAGQGWLKLTAAAKQQSRRFGRPVAVWAAPPNAPAAHWRRVDLPKRTPGLSGLRRR